MERAVYGRRMFVADMLIVSAWALFVWYVNGSLPTVMALPAMRLALSFAMKRHSRWSWFEALMFAIAYCGFLLSSTGAERLTSAVRKMMFVGLSLAGQSTEAVELSGHEAPVTLRLAFMTIFGMLSAWLVVMPLICSFRFGNCHAALRDHTRLWWYLAFIVGATAFVHFETNGNAVVIFSILMSLLPVADWCLYAGKHRQLIGRLLADHALMSYLGIATVFLSALTIGLDGIDYARGFAAFVLPAALYIIGVRLVGHQPSTLPALLFGFGGLFFINIMQRSHQAVIVCLALGICLTLTAALLTLRQSKKTAASLFLFIANAAILPLLLLGYNPWSTLTADDVSPFHQCSGQRGLYMFSSDNLEGVRDRYGVVIPARYRQCSFIEDAPGFMILSRAVTDSAGLSLQIFDLLRRETVLPDDGHIVTEIIKKEPDKYALFDSAGRQVYTLVLDPEEHFDADNEVRYDYRRKKPRTVDCIVTAPDDTTNFSSDLKVAEMQLIALCGDDDGGYCYPPLATLLRSDKATLGYSFDKLQKQTPIGVTTSPDGRIRLYSWNTGMGGTSPDFETIVQYSAGDSVIVDRLCPGGNSRYMCEGDVLKDGHDTYESPYCGQIYQIAAEGGKHLYIIDCYSKASSSEGYQECFLVSVEGERLVKLPVVHQDGETDFSVDSDYNIPAWYFTTDGMGWDWVMNFDRLTATLYAPQHGNREMTDRYDLYRYSDGALRYASSGAGHWLHPSLHEFKRLAGIYRTQSVRIRVDEMNDGSFRYAAWQKNKPMSDAPEIVIHGGKIGAQDNQLIFINGDYTYITPAFRQGNGNDFGKLIVRHKGKTLHEEDV